VSVSLSDWCVQLSALHTPCRKKVKLDYVNYVSLGWDIEAMRRSRRLCTHVSGLFIRLFLYQIRMVKFTDLSGAPGRYGEARRVLAGESV